MNEMMDMMNFIAKEKGAVKLEDKIVEGQSAKLDGTGSVHKQCPAFKYNAENPFVIRGNELEVGASELSSSRTTTNLVKAREEKDMMGHVSLPSKYAELHPMLIDNNFLTPVRFLPKIPPFLASEGAQGLSSKCEILVKANEEFAIKKAVSGGWRSLDDDWSGWTIAEFWKWGGVHPVFEEHG
ncbi:hypothetical protein GQ457_15G017610 [Hibiscus cannabinus]